MASLWSSLFRGKNPERLSVNDWAEMFNFNGNAYPLNIMPRSSGNEESTPNDFQSYVQGAYKASGIVYACLVTRMWVFADVRFQYQMLNKGRPGDLFGSDRLSILETPWPNGTTQELLSRALQDADLAGNHYVLKEGFGPTERLRRLRPDWVDIILSAAPDEAVQSDVVGYRYRPGGTLDKELWEIYPIDGSKGTIVHWSPIPDPDAQYRGMSPLTPVMKEIMADKAATTHKSKFFENAATPNLAVSFKDTVTNEQFKEFMETMDSAKNGVEHAYETLYLGGGADVTVIGANMQQMDFKATQGHGEERIAAALRVHPLLIGTSGGFSREPLSSESLTAAKDLFADGTLRPMWASICAAYAPLVDGFKGSRLWYDDRDIAFLRQDRQQVAEIRDTEASTLSSYITSGFTPDSSIEAIKHNDITLLDHTGLYSVQLQPPGMGDANTPDPIDGAVNPTANPSEGDG